MKAQNSHLRCDVKLEGPLGIGLRGLGFRGLERAVYGFTGLCEVI